MSFLHQLMNGNAFIKRRSIISFYFLFCRGILAFFDNYLIFSCQETSGLSFNFWFLNIGRNEAGYETHPTFHWIWSNQISIFRSMIEGKCLQHVSRTSDRTQFFHSTFILICCTQVLRTGRHNFRPSSLQKLKLSSGHLYRLNCLHTKKSKSSKIGCSWMHQRF